MLDGHCGTKAAKMVGHEFHKILQEKIELTKNASDIEIMNKAGKEKTLHKLKK